MTDRETVRPWRQYHADIRLYCVQQYDRLINGKLMSVLQFVRQRAISTATSTLRVSKTAIANAEVRSSLAFIITTKNNRDLRSPDWLLKPCPHCRRKVRLWDSLTFLRQWDCTVSQKWDCTVSLLWDSLTFLRQCGQGLRLYCRRKVKLSHKSETVAQVRQSHFSATVWTGHYSFSYNRLNQTVNYCSLFLPSADCRRNHHKWPYELFN